MRANLPTDRIGFIALAFLGISVLIHLVGGLTELYAVLTSHGTIVYAALMLIGVAIPIVVLGAMVSGVLQPRATYATLSGVMVLYIITYADVHALGYLEAITGADFHTHEHNGHEHNGHEHNGHDDHDHGESVLNTVGDHLVDDPVALISKVSEAAAAIFFALLATREQ